MTEPGFEDFEGLSPSQRYARLRQIIREADELLNRNGVLRIQSNHNPYTYWEVDGGDTQSATHYAEEGCLREGGLNHTIYLLLMAGF